MSRMVDSQEIKTWKGCCWQHFKSTRWSHRSSRVYVCVISMLSSFSSELWIYRWNRQIGHYNLMSYMMMKTTLSRQRRLCHQGYVWRRIFANPEFIGAMIQILRDWVSNFLARYTYTNIKHPCMKSHEPCHYIVWILLILQTVKILPFLHRFMEEWNGEMT